MGFLPLQRLDVLESGDIQGRPHPLRRKEEGGEGLCMGGTRRGGSDWEIDR